MPNQIYKKGSYVVFKSHGHLIVHNTDLNFDEGHTHVIGKNHGNRMYQAKLLIHHAMNNKVPKKFNKRLFESLIRITDNEAFKTTIQGRLNARGRKDKKPDYVNVPRSVGAY